MFLAELGRLYLHALFSVAVYIPAMACLFLLTSHPSELILPAD